MALNKHFSSAGLVRFLSPGGSSEGFSTAAITHPDIASLVHLLFAARKEGFKKALVNGA